MNRVHSASSNVSRYDNKDIHYLEECKAGDFNPFKKYILDQ